MCGLVISTLWDKHAKTCSQPLFSSVFLDSCHGNITLIDLVQDSTLKHPTVWVTQYSFSRLGIHGNNTSLMEICPTVICAPTCWTYSDVLQSSIRFNWYYKLWKRDLQLLPNTVQLVWVNMNNCTVEPHFKVIRYYKTQYDKVILLDPAHYKVYISLVFLPWYNKVIFMGPRSLLLRGSTVLQHLL